MLKNLTGMTRNEIIQKARGKYVRLKGKAERSHFLSFFCEQTGIKRKYAQKLLSGKRDGSGKGRHEQQGRPRKYTPEDAEIIRTIWLRSVQPCSRRLKGTLNMWLKSYSKHVRILSQQEEERLCQISASQLDRILKSFRVEMPRTKSWLRGRSVESAGQPRDIRAENGKVNAPGWMEMDCSALCGEISGSLELHRKRVAC